MKKLFISIVVSMFFAFNLYAGCKMGEPTRFPEKPTNSEFLVTVDKENMVLTVKTQIEGDYYEEISCFAFDFITEIRGQLLDEAGINVSTLSHDSSSNMSDLTDLYGWASMDLRTAFGPMTAPTYINSVELMFSKDEVVDKTGNEIVVVEVEAQLSRAFIAMMKTYPEKFDRVTPEIREKMETLSVRELEEYVFEKMYPYMLTLIQTYQSYIH